MIRPYIDDSRPEFCRSAIVALGDIDHPHSFSTLKELMAKGCHLDIVLCSLARLGDTSIIPTCERMMQTKDPAMQSVAIAAMTSFSPERAIPLLEEWSELEMASQLRAALNLALVQKKSMKGPEFLKQKLLENEIEWMSIVVALASIQNRIDARRGRMLLELLKVVDRVFSERVFLIYAGIIAEPGSVWFEKIHNWIKNLVEETV